MESWPAGVREKIAAISAGRTVSHGRRLARGLDVWLEKAAAEGAPPEVVSQQAWRRRAACLSPEEANAMRAAVAAVYGGHAELYAAAAPSRTQDAPRTRLAALVAARLPEWPAAWADRARPLLHVDEDALIDGRLVTAWKPGTIRRRVWSLTWVFRHAASAGLPPDLTPAVVRSWLAAEQARSKPDAITGKSVISATSVAITLGCVAALAPLLMPERPWGWLRRAATRMTDMVRNAPSRNESRVVDAPTLRDVGHAYFEVAEERLAAALTRRERTKAFRLARAGLAVALLPVTPVRLGSFNGLDLERSFAPGFASFLLEDTKEGEPDTRAVPPALQAMIARFVEAFRPIAASRSCTRLFVSATTGGPLTDGALALEIARAIECVLGCRVNPQAIRHSVATYIVSAAPAESALASEILHHYDPATTNAYRRRAKQFVAGRALNAATERSKADLEDEVAARRTKRKIRAR